VDHVYECARHFALNGLAYSGGLTWTNQPISLHEMLTIGPILTRHWYNIVLRIRVGRILLVRHRTAWG